MLDALDQPYFAFLSSRIEGLEALRARIGELGKAHGRRIWISDIDSQDAFGEKDLEFIQIACLQQVRKIEKFICILDGTYGTTWANSAKTSILELEIATAAFSKRDIRVFLLEPFDRIDPRLFDLLSTIKVCCQKARVYGPLSQQELLDQVARFLDVRNEARPLGMGIGSLVHTTAWLRSPVINSRLAAKDVRFLGNLNVALDRNTFDREIVERLISRAHAESVVPMKLAWLWIALRHLHARPFEDRANIEILPLWEAALSGWSSASAWYGLHGHFLLGRLAAVNSLSAVRGMMPDEMLRRHGATSIFGGAGAAASEYYSMATLVPARLTAAWLNGKALYNCQVALKSPATFDRSGLLDIRGHVRLQLMNIPGGLGDLRSALKLRRQNGEPPYRIGESEMHLGHAYSRLHLHRLAEHLLEDGVKKLRFSPGSCFLVQGMRHLGEHYAAVGRIDDARKTLCEAKKIAEMREVLGQLHSIHNLLNSL